MRRFHGPVHMSDLLRRDGRAAGRRQRRDRPAREPVSGAHFNPVGTLATAARGGQWGAEVVATSALVLVALRAPASRASALVAAWIGAADGFTTSTPFANPAAVFGRMLGDTCAGIAPAFVAVELAGGALALFVHRLLGETSFRRSHA